MIEDEGRRRIRRDVGSRPKGRGGAGRGYRDPRVGRFPRDSHTDAAPTRHTREGVNFLRDAVLRHLEVGSGQVGDGPPLPVAHHDIDQDGGCRGGERLGIVRRVRGLRKGPRRRQGSQRQNGGEYNEMPDHE